MKTCRLIWFQNKVLLYNDIKEFLKKISICIVLLFIFSNTISIAKFRPIGSLLAYRHFPNFSGEAKNCFIFVILIQRTCILFCKHNKSWRRTKKNSYPARALFSAILQVLSFFQFLVLYLLIFCKMLIL